MESQKLTQGFFQPNTTYCRWGCDWRLGDFSIIKRCLPGSIYARRLSTAVITVRSAGCAAVVATKESALETASSYQFQTFVVA